MKEDWQRSVIDGIRYSLFIVLLFFVFVWLIEVARTRVL